MAISIERTQTYLLISAIEEDFRSFIESQLLSQMGEKEALGNFYESAVSKRQREIEADDISSVIEYLDFQSQYEILRTWKHLLDSNLRHALDENGEKFNWLTKCRNRISHTRPLQSDDYIEVREICKSLLSAGWEGTSLEATIRELEANPYWSASIEVPTVAAPILNNLPDVDYDETGLIGQAKFSDRLTQC